MAELEHRKEADLMKKILIFSTAYFPLVGGAEVAIKEIAARLPEAEFDLITARMEVGLAGYEKIGNVDVYRLGVGTALDKFLLPFFGLIFALILNIRRKYDVIWSMMASQASIAAAIFRILEPRAKLVLTLQEGDEEEHLKRWAGGNDFLYKTFIRPLHFLVFKKADAITVISKHLENRAKHSGAKAPVFLVPNGVDFEKFGRKLPEGEKAKLKETLGIGENDRIIVTASRLVKKNAVGDLIKAMAEIENAKLLIMGDGPDREKLEKLTRELAVESKVIFFGLFDNDDLPKYLEASDVFCRPSLSEGQGIAFLEAMAAGLPVVAAKVGGIPDFLADGETGLFCETHNPKDIAQKISSILNDEALAQKLADNGRKLISEHYSWDPIANKMGHIFNTSK